MKCVMKRIHYIQGKNIPKLSSLHMTTVEIALAIVLGKLSDQKPSEMLSQIQVLDAH